MVRTPAEMSPDIYQNGDKPPPHDTLGSPKPIAIIGMGCRLPAKATNVENFWTEIANGQSGWAPHPPDRYRADKYYHPNPDKKGCFNSKGAHYLEEDFARFDAQFFNVTGAEAIAMDPQQRHLLEVSYEAFENAGIPLSKLAGTNTGVFVGGSSSDYRTHLHQDLENSPMFEPIGNADSLLSNRLSYTYDLKGPSMSLDTACSSSLSALHTAFRSLQTGESSVAVVGGSHLNIRPETFVGLSTMRLLSPDGRSYAFDERATSGFGRGEGTVCIILKPLDAALKAGDPIRAIVRNTGASQDGKTAGVTMPNGSAQAALMRSVYKSAGLNPQETSYIEAHGTGTATGDPIEATALGEVFQRKPHQSPLIIGSLKSNIGHLEGASGVASVLKTALMLERKFIPPNFDFRDPNREIPFKKWNMKVSSKLIPWEPPGIRRASINNFGFGGSNAHIIMEESVPPTSHYAPNGVPLTNGHAHQNGVPLTNGHAHQNGVPLTNGHAHQISVPLTNGHAHQNGISLTNGHARQNGNVRTVSTPLKQHVYIFSASDRESLERLLSKITVYVKERPVVLYSDLLDHLAFTLGQRRSILSWKFAFSASTPDALFQSMTDPTLTPRKSSSQPSIGFLFTGQGSQWATMGRGLCQAYPAYASAVRKADDALRSLGASWSLMVELEKPEEVSNIDRPYISQPASTALQIALVELLRSWGVYPQKVVGHSSGEIAAAYSAGILDLEACMAVAYWRGVVSTTLSEKSKYVRGGMIAIGASQELTQALIDDCVQGKLVIACINSPSSMTVSGDEGAISEIQHLADKRAVWNRRLKIDVAYHSHHILRVADKYRSLLGDVQPKSRTKCSSEFFSSLIGRMVDPTFLDASYWVENLTSQVRFSEALKLLCEPGAGDEERNVDVLVEVGPHSALQGPARQVLQNLQSGSKDIQYCPSLVRGEDSITAVQRLAARLFMEGCQLDMGAVNFPNPPKKPIKVLTDLPTYQWNHSKRFWHETRASREAQLLASQRHDLLGTRVPESSMLEPQWKNILIADNVPWLRDHKVQGLTVFPMAGYLCMAMEAYRQQASWKQVKYNRIVFREISVHQALSVPESTPVELRVSLAPHAEGPRTTSDKWSEFKVFSWTSDRDWLEHCRGLVASESSEERNNPVECVASAQHRLESSANDLERLKDACNHPADAADIYRVVAEAGFEYGPTFRHMENVMIGPSVVKYKAIVPDSAASMPCCYESGYTIHPITLDLIFQSVWPLITNGGSSLDVPYMPIAIRRMEVSTNLTMTPGAAHQVIARMEKADKFSKKPSVDVDSLDQQSHFETADVSIRGLIGAPIQSSATRAEVQRAQCFKTQWEPCVPYLTQSQSSALFSLPPPASETIDDLWVLERLSCDYMEEALSQTAPDCINSPHLLKLYNWMEKQVKLVQEGQSHNVRPELLRMSHDDRQALRNATTLLGPYGHLIRRIGENLSSILQGQIEPLAIMLEDNLLSRFYAELDSYQRRYAVATSYIQKLSHQNPALRLIEIGGGTASATVPILQALGGGTTNKIAGFAAYDFTDITSGFFETAKARLSPWGQLVEYRKLDIEASPADQGFQAGSYDVVVASDVLHATAMMRRTMANVHSLLKPGGKLVLIEETGCAKRLRWLPFATLPGWWLGNEHDAEENSGGLNAQISREDGPLLAEEQWEVLFSSSGFSGLDGAVQDYPDHPEQSASVMFTTALAQGTDTQTPEDEIVIIGGTVPGGYFWSEMETLLQKHSPAKVTWLPLSEVADFTFDRQYCILIDDPEHQYLDTMNAESFRGLQRALQCPGLLWVCGSLDLPASGMVKGLCRTIRSENPNTNIVTLAIEDWTTPRREAAILISDVFQRSFYPATACTEHDTELAEKDGVVCVPRFTQDVVMSDSLNREFRHDINYLQSFSQPSRPLKLTISSPGFLDTLCFVDDEIAARELPDDEIEIDIKASGLNFKDVILALGQLAGNHIGQECSGKIKRVGNAVADLKAGDRVCSVTESSIANFGRCKAACATIIPETMSYLEAASIPIIYCTAQYCLSHIARLQPGETVLIHAAAGGVGQAAIMLAQAMKARILTTVGSLEKKTFLTQTYNIPEECIFYSRDTSFAQGIMDATAGKGVDVVLNSLAGEQMRATWECMAPFGRFVEIGKRDITSNLNLEMSRFERNVSFTAVDLTDLVQHRRNILQQLLVEVMDMFDGNIIKPVSPIHKFGVSEVETAFRLLQSGKLMGKLVIVPEEDETVMATRPALEFNIFHPDVSYLITGGTGGIGRAICRWMVHQGARNIILASRSGLTQKGTKEMIESLRPFEAKIEVRQCDAGIESNVRCMVSECAKIMPPIRGVIHGAFVNKDVLFDQAEYSDWTQVIQPKVQGAWNLHSTLLPQPLDFFILLSSVSGIIGNRGQAAYAAASSFLDSFAHFRASKGLPATAIDLGVVSEIGWVAERPEMQQSLEALTGGSSNLTEADVLTLVKLAVTGQIDKHSDHQTTVGLSLENYHPDHPSAFWASDARFAHLRRAAAATSTTTTTTVQATPKQSLKAARSAEEAVTVATQGLLAKFSNVLIVPVEEIAVNKPVVALGLDSLIAVEVRSWITREMEAAMTTMELMTAGSIGAVAEMVVARSKLCEGLDKGEGK